MKIFAIILILASLSYFNLFFRLLLFIFPLGWAYVVDQLLPAIAVVFLAWFTFKRYVPKVDILSFLRTHIKVLITLVIATLVVRGWILEGYFYGEELRSIIEPVVDGDLEHLISPAWRGWHLGLYVGSFLLFGHNTLPLNTVSLILYLLCILSLYLLLFLLFKKTLPAFVAVLFYITTPVYQNFFNWQAHVSGTSLALFLGILSLIFLLFFQKNSKKMIYIVSILLFAVSIKISLARMFGFVALPVFLSFFPKLSLTKSLKSSVLQAAPFILLWLSVFLFEYLLPQIFYREYNAMFGIYFPESVTLEPLSVRRSPLNFQGYHITLAAFTTALFLPTQMAAELYPFLKGKLFTMFSTIDISITFAVGLIAQIMLIILGVFAATRIKKGVCILIIFALVFIFTNMFYFPPTLGSVYTDLKSLDDTFISADTSSGPGLRYLFVPTVGLAILLGLLVDHFNSTKRNSRFLLSVLLVAIFTVSGFLSIKSYRNMLQDALAQKILPNHIFSMVPQGNEMKLLFSTNPAINKIDDKLTKKQSWLYSFYWGRIIYLKNVQDVREAIADKNISRENFYAFYNDPHTQAFKDVSTLARSELYDGVVEQGTILLGKEINLTTSFTTTDDPSFPRILNRGIYISDELSQRILAARWLSIFLQKKKLPAKYPYMDGFVVEKGSLVVFPLGVLDMLKNKPFQVSVKQVTLALSIKSLDNSLINTLSSKQRIEIAKEMIKNETIEDETVITVSDVEQINKHYIDSQEILNTFLDGPSFNSLALVYACAEDSDWEKQKKSPEMLGVIWYAKEFPLNKNQGSQKLSMPFTCFGSVLRKIILIGPPIPSEITIRNISLGEVVK